MRSLCEDMGKLLGCGACMGELTRTRSGHFSLESAITLSALKQAAGEDRLGEFLIPAEKALPFPKAEIKEAFINRAVNGNPMAYEHLLSMDTGAVGEKFWLCCNGELIGLYQREREVFKPRVMMR
ncbi:MAG: hypothetical protein LBR83_04200 [Clostridiales bacterium]|nr:hypothetical protein [Clostridiales bacterium]